MRTADTTALALRADVGAVLAVGRVGGEVLQALETRLLVRDRGETHFLSGADLAAELGANLAALAAAAVVRVAEGVRVSPAQLVVLADER